MRINSRDIFVILFYLTTICFIGYFAIFSLTNQSTSKVRYSKFTIEHAKIGSKILKLPVETSFCVGLGNMMFRVAGIMNFSKVLNRKPCIQSTTCAQTYYSELIMTFPNIPKDILSDNCGKAKKGSKRILFAKSCWKYDDIRRLILLDKKDDIFEIDTSYLQSFKFFDRSLTKELFEFSPIIKNYVDGYSKALLGNDPNRVPKICVHLRGGDFSDHILLPTDIDSTASALNYILKKYTNDGDSWLFIFSDDTKLPIVIYNIVSNISANTDVHALTGLSRSQLLYFSSTQCDIFLMSSPGSTFGWWLAYMMDDQKQDQVFYLDRFFRPYALKQYLKDFNEDDFFYPKWQRLNIVKDGIFSSRKTGIYSVLVSN